MSKKNPEYDFKWCPGCGDFGVKRALEMGVEKRNIELEQPMVNTVVVAGIGCSGNLVHLLDGVQPFGIHGLHGRSLPVAFGVKMGQPDLNVIIVSGDGDFPEHRWRAHCAPGAEEPERNGHHHGQRRIRADKGSELTHHGAWGYHTHHALR